MERRHAERSGVVLRQAVTGLMGKAVLARALMAGRSPLGQVTPPVLLGTLGQEQVPGLGQELAPQLRWTALRSLKAAWKKTLVLQGGVPERAACVLCWKILTWDVWSPGEAALFPLGALSQSHRWLLANGHGGSARPRPAQQRCAQLQWPEQQQWWGAGR